jgi:hypothetical protein
MSRQGRIVLTNSARGDAPDVLKGSSVAAAAACQLLLEITPTPSKAIYRSSSAVWLAHIITAASNTLTAIWRNSISVITTASYLAWATKRAQRNSSKASSASVLLSDGLTKPRRPSANARKFLRWRHAQTERKAHARGQANSVGDRDDVGDGDAG